MVQLNHSSGRIVRRNYRCQCMVLVDHGNWIVQAVTTLNMYGQYGFIELLTSMRWLRHTIVSATMTEW